MRLRIDRITHRLVALGEIISHHSSHELALAAAKKFARENNMAVAIEEWTIIDFIAPNSLRKKNKENE